MTYDIALIAGIYESGNATLVSETCPRIKQMSSKIMVQFSTMISAPLGHPHKMFRFPSPDRPIFFGKVKKKKVPESLVKKQVL